MPFVWLSLAFLSGIFLASFWNVSWAVWLGIGLLPIAGVFVLPKLPWKWAALLSRRHALMKFAPLLLLSLLGAGGLRYTLAQPRNAPTDLASYNNQGMVRLTGTVSEPPDRRETTTLLYLRAESITSLDGKFPTQNVRGQLLVMLSSGASWQFGDRLELIGKPTSPKETPDFSYRDYLSHRGIFTTLQYPRIHLLERGASGGYLAWLFNLRERAAEVIAEIFPAPEAPLLTGILLGDDSGLPVNVVRAFRASGTAHIIAISGFNMVVLAGLFSTLFRRLLRRGWATLGAILTLVVYTLLVGSNPAVVRALIMSSLSLVAVQIGRPGGGLNSLLLAAGFMCLGSPGLLWDVSFQLSCAATLGLILYAGPLQGAATRLLERRLAPQTAQRTAAPIAEYFLFTLAAQAATLPIIAFHFQRVSFSALLANPLILPPQPLVMILGGSAVIGGLIWPPLGQALGWAASPFAAYTVRIAEIFGGLPSGEWVINSFHPFWLVIYYGLLLGITFARGWLARFQIRLKPAIVLVVLGSLALFTWRIALSGTAGRLHIYQFNLNGNIATLVRAPEGQSLLIDGADSSKALGDVLARRLPPTQRSLSAWLYTGSKSSIQGLPGLFERYPPQTAYFCTGLPTSKSTGNDLNERLLNTPQTRLLAGQELQLGEVTAWITTAEAGCALQLRYGRFDAQLQDGVLRLWNMQARELPAGRWLHFTTDGERLWIEEGP